MVDAVGLSLLLEFYTWALYVCTKNVFSCRLPESKPYCIFCFHENQMRNIRNEDKAAVWLFHKFLYWEKHFMPLLLFKFVNDFPASLFNWYSEANNWVIWRCTEHTNFHTLLGKHVSKEFMYSEVPGCEACRGAASSLCLWASLACLHGCKGQIAFTHAHLSSCSLSIVNIHLFLETPLQICAVVLHRSSSSIKIWSEQCESVRRRCVRALREPPRPHRVAVFSHQRL